MAKPENKKNVIAGSETPKQSQAGEIRDCFAAVRNDRKRIAIFGGAFDPPHVGHLVIAETARQQFGLDKVVFVPAGVPPHKAPPVAAGPRRLEMVEAALAGNPFFAASGVEIRRKGVSYTFDTVRELKSAGGNAAIFLITGSDAFKLLDTWRNGEQLGGEVSFLVAARPGGEKGAKPDLPFPVACFFIDNPALDVSSSLIRKLCKEKKSIKYLVPKEVEELIKRNHLYE